MLLVLVVVAGSGPALLGRNWLHHIHLNWEEIGTAVHRTSANSLESVLARYASVYNELGCIRPFQAKLLVRPDAQPKFYCPRPVPFAIKGAIEDKLDHLEGEGILEKVTHSDWAAPIVVPNEMASFVYVIIRLQLTLPYK